ncbi:dienelactone hydrolase family protein [Azospirillum sp. SYSU D00513]|uniref:dienelactone hydrolase family protein n=1 Tax=Azospirillum sp. SYSU D00513 TaxID=2812561 RepID=UPI001A956954|nr:dienelactone hydrolase family protein [Azospirillum sp. SYSU D00513]
MAGQSAGDWLELTATDGHGLAAYQTGPREGARGALVIVQEIFGVNSHIRGVCDAYAAEGFRVIAPALFDRVERKLELGYGDDGVKRGIALKQAIPDEQALLDIAAALDALGGAGEAAVMGYCWGGSLAWRAASALRPRAAIGYYGGGIGQHLDEAPGCPTLLHFGEKDHAIPLSVAEGVRARHPSVPCHIYPAGHGFNCDERGSYDAESARIARERTLGFLRAVF